MKRAITLKVKSQISLGLNIVGSFFDNVNTQLTAEIYWSLQIVNTNMQKLKWMNSSLYVDIRRSHTSAGREKLAAVNL